MYGFTAKWSVPMQCSTTMSPINKMQYMFDYFNLDVGFLKKLQGLMSTNTNKIPEILYLELQSNYIEYFDPFSYVLDNYLMNEQNRKNYPL